MITVQIKGSRVAVSLFLLEFSNTEGHPYVTVYSCWCLWTGWGTELVSLVPLLTGDWEVENRSTCSSEFCCMQKPWVVEFSSFYGWCDRISMPGGFHRPGSPPWVGRSALLSDEMQETPAPFSCCDSLRGSAALVQVCMQEGLLPSWCCLLPSYREGRNGSCPREDFCMCHWLFLADNSIG